jgi:hypothetical protein
LNNIYRENTCKSTKARKVKYRRMKRKILRIEGGRFKGQGLRLVVLTPYAFYL